MKSISVLPLSILFLVLLLVIGCTENQIIPFPGDSDEDSESDTDSKSDTELINADALVFMLLGQSNSHGRADLTTLQSDYADGPLLDVLFFNGSTFVPMNAADNGNSNQYPNASGHFGPEFSFAARLQEFYQKDIYLIKYAIVV